jgi:hypothetical protein
MISCDLSSSPSCFAASGTAVGQPKSIAHLTRYVHLSFSRPSPRHRVRGCDSSPWLGGAGLGAVVVAGSCLGGGRGPHESEFDRDLLLEELVAVGALDGGPGLVEGGVFDEHVALAAMHQHTRYVYAWLDATVLSRLLRTYLDVTCAAVQVHVQVLDGAVLAKHVLQVLLGRLLMHVGDDDDPALDGTHGGRAGLGARVAGLGVRRRGFLLLGRVDVHLRVGHGGRVRGAVRVEGRRAEAGAAARRGCGWPSREKLPTAVSSCSTNTSVREEEQHPGLRCTASTTGHLN